MEATTQPAPEYYVWEVPGGGLAIHLHLDVVDRLFPEVMRGFGAVPKRGAEVGGVLIGSVEDGEQAIVRIEDFELVECAYKRGPSYLFSEDDAAGFEDACAAWSSGEAGQARAVGYFRSHTRDGFSLSTEDLNLLDHFFPEPSGVALLIRPFATQASVAGFFFREDGKFQETTLLEFPFRRRDLALGQPGSDRRHEMPVAAMEPPAPADPVPAPRKTWLSAGILIPLAFVFLLLGVLLGFEAASIRGNRALTANSQELGLAVAKTGENLTLKWNPNAPAIRAAQGGSLEILDGSSDKPVDLDQAHLENGRIVYRNTSNLVRFRLTVFLNSRLSVTETVDWQQ